jgi:uncharacterized protein DUF5309
MAQTFIRAAESTENIPAARRVRDVADRMAWLNPNAAPFTLILQKARKRPAINTKFEWGEKDLPAKWDQVNGAQTNVDTAIEVDNAAYYSVHDLVKLPRTGEVFRVTAVNTGTNTLTVVRGVGETAGAAMNDNDDIVIIGSGHPEGAPLGVEKSHQETVPFNYAEIFRNPLGETGSEAASENYFGRDRAQLRMEKAVEHKIDIERSFLFGERNIDISNTNASIPYTRGVLQWLEAAGSGAVLMDAGGTLTESELATFMGSIFQATGASDTRVLLASKLGVDVFDAIAGARLQTVPSDKTYGIAVTRYISSHGEFLIVKDRLLENGPGGTGYGGYVVAVDPSSLAYRFLRTRDTKLRIDVQAPGDDKWTDEYMTQAGLQLTHPSTMGRIKGITG